MITYKEVFYGFNPRPRVGGDRSEARNKSELTGFQSTPPRGGRHNKKGKGSGLLCFNPRPRVGGDPILTLHVGTT